MTLHLNGKYKKEKGVLKSTSIYGDKQYELFDSNIQEGAVI